MAARYDSMPIWQNRSSLQMLKYFRALIEEYSANLSKGSWMADFAVSENEKSRELRPLINRTSHGARCAVSRAGLNPTYNIVYPPTMGGGVFLIDLVADPFLLLQHKRQNLQGTIDLMDKAIGVYENDRKRAWIRTLNPIFWVGLLVDWVASLPFQLVGKLGG